MSDLVEYYRERAEEYDEIYEWRDPHRQEEQLLLREAIKESLEGRRVLEVACGTGYWTRILSQTAESIMATDLGQEVMELANEKKYACPVRFRKEDAYNLSFSNGSYDGGFSFSWFSHIPRKRVDSFLTGFHRVLKAGSRVFMADNAYIPGVGGKLIKLASSEDTYKKRTLKDGREFTIIKNYYSTDELKTIFNRHVNGFDLDNIFHGNCFWYVSYEIT
jgi:ubiquinone/menaquinone biosynthesis C-methylase UbiE